MLRRSFLTLFQLAARPSCSRTTFPRNSPLSLLDCRHIHGSKFFCSLERSRRQEEFEQRINNSRRQVRKRRPISSIYAKNVNHDNPK
ncbi:hypothetical protein Y032_0203g1820 [Ancylostoma ceylanicum]|uniref:Uncharacterized protein n=1 Tax=Ancylostoma ceylanicum TaxID=53326 RepID=A0A016SLT5_9BILA|nr:hypothetical protein Y032_0203g1820 [Ancylostoma ceylanicum]